MLNHIRRGVMLGIGLVRITANIVRREVHLLVEAGHITKEEGEKLANALLKKAVKGKDELEEFIKAHVYEEIRIIRKKAPAVKRKVKKAAAKAKKKVKTVAKKAATKVKAKAKRAVKKTASRAKTAVKRKVKAVAKKGVRAVKKVVRKVKRAPAKKAPKKSKPVKKR